MGASDYILIQMVKTGGIACFIGLILCIIVVEVRGRSIKAHNKERRIDVDRWYRIHLSNRQKDEDYEMNFQKEIIVGRSPEVSNLILQDDRSVSKQHFKVTAEDGQFLVEDLNSSNHTWLNGRRVTGKVPIKTGDRVVAGYYSYLVKLEEDVKH